jgi:hypothetical protein
VSQRKSKIRVCDRSISGCRTLGGDQRPEQIRSACIWKLTLRTTLGRFQPAFMSPCASSRCCLRRCRVAPFLLLVTAFAGDIESILHVEAALKRGTAGLKRSGEVVEGRGDWFTDLISPACLLNYLPDFIRLLSVLCGFASLDCTECHVGCHIVDTVHGLVTEQSRTRPRTISGSRPDETPFRDFRRKTVPLQSSCVALDTAVHMKQHVPHVTDETAGLIRTLNQTVIIVA